MRFDFWNNPLVVTAFRLKARRASPLIIICLYVCALIGLGALFQVQSVQPLSDWVRTYFVTIMGIQFLISALSTFGTTHASLHAEVVNRTLDFQRIATLSPAQIALGKLLGEPSTGYFLALATIPVTLWCSMMGAVSLPVLLLLYVQLATAMLMYGSVGLVQPLEPSPKSATASSQRSNWGWIVILVLVPQFIFQSMAWSGNRWVDLAIGSLSPILGLRDVIRGTPWKSCLTFYEIPIPYLLTTPVIQLALAALCLQTTTRRLTNPHHPPLSKAWAYVVLIAVDVLAAGIAFEPLPFVQEAQVQGAVFCVVHLLCSLVLISLVTPSKEGLLSWIWRFRGRRPWPADSAFGDRSENTVALLIFSLIGAVGLIALLIVPLMLSAASAQVLPDAVWSIASVLLATMLLIVSIGSMYQWFVLVAARSGRVAFLLLMAILVILPAVFGEYYQIDPLRAASPASQIFRWVGRSAGQLPLAPLVSVYGLAWAGSALLVRRRMGQHIAKIDRKLREMQAGDAPSTDRPKYSADRQEAGAMRG